MGRRRKHDKHLPQRLYLSHGQYYFQSTDRKWIPLGRDLAAAIARYADLIGRQWSGRTLGDVIDRYRVEVLPLKGAQTRKDQARELDRLKLVYGDMLPDEVSAQDLYGYLDARAESPVAARHEISLLGHVYAKAIRWGACSLNPVRALERQPKSRRTRYVTDAEFSAVHALADERMRIAMDLALLTGQRRGDLLSLRHAQCGEIGIEFRQGKTGAGVIVEWAAELRAVIERAKKLTPDLPREYVIRQRNGRRYTARGFSAIWQRLMTAYVESGGERFTYHDLRAKSASDSASVAEAQARLGHTTEAMTRRAYIRRPVRARPLR